jgi:CRISPR-associated protein Csm3
MKKVAQYVIRGVIELKSGTRIGGSEDVLQIGATDLTCIKDPVSGKPYIPGSSLKGRMRAELEKALGRTGGPHGNEPCGCGRNDCAVCRIFGPHRNSRHQLGPTRIIVRDAPLIEGGQIELKTETTNRRSTGGAEQPRTLERVTSGAKFRLEIAIQEFDIDQEFHYRDADGTEVNGRQALVAAVYHCLDMLEDSGIGSGVSRGSGQVAINLDDHIAVAGRRRKVPAMQ